MTCSHNGRIRLLRPQRAGSTHTVLSCCFARHIDAALRPYAMPEPLHSATCSMRVTPPSNASKPKQQRQDLYSGTSRRSVDRRTPPCSMLSSLPAQPTPVNLHRLSSNAGRVDSKLLTDSSCTAELSQQPAQALNQSLNCKQGSNSQEAAHTADTAHNAAAPQNSVLCR